MPVMRGAVSARVDVCYFCGEPARVDAAGISNHLTEDEEIDHDADADHVAVIEAVIEPECSKSPVAHCSECAWVANTQQDMELIDDTGAVIYLSHIGCPECGAMIQVVDGVAK